MDVGQPACPQVGVLGLGPVILQEDMSQGALLWCSHQGATLPCIKDREIKLPLVYDQPPCLPFSVNNAALENLPTTEQASSLPSGNQTSVCLPKETIAFLTLSLQQAYSTRNTKGGIWAQPASVKCLPNQAGMTGSLKLPFLDLNEACAFVPGESAIDSYAGHMVDRMPEPLKLGFCFSHTLERRRIAGLHIDADDVPRIVVHRVPQPAVSVLQTSLLNVLELVSRRSFPWP